jgi:PRTRC genetic system protein B
MEEISVDRLDVYAAIAKSSYLAKKAMIFYENDMIVDNNKQYCHDYTNEARRLRSFVTIHDIRNNVVCEGQSIARETLEELVVQLVPSISRPMIIPPNLIMYQPGIGMAWWAPARVRKLYFSAETKIKSGMAPVPALLFLVRDSNLYVWALGKDARPELFDPVYHAPFFNLSDGHMCTGNVQLPDLDLKDIPKWQNVVFKSRFTNHGGVRLKGASMKGLWDSLIGKDKKVFPLQHLVKAGTIKSVLKAED